MIGANRRCSARRTIGSVIATAADGLIAVAARPLFARAGPRPAGSMLFQGEEPKGRHHQARVMVEATP